MALVVLVAAGLPVGCGADDPGGGRGAGGSIDRCDWPMWGYSIERTFSSPCDTAIAPDTVDQLHQAWFFNADDAVTATPAVVDGTAYVGDWSGRFYALDVETGELVWAYRTEPHPPVYAGQIVSSAAVAEVGGRRIVYFGGGKTLYALDAEDGGCGRTDATGAPLADAVDKDLFIPADQHAPTPNAVALAGEGRADGFYVTSAFTGTIARYDDQGSFVETLLAPPAGEAFGGRPYSTGTPLGLAVAPDGALYFADLGLGLGEDGVGPLPQAGSVRRLGSGSDTPEVIDSNLEFPDGIGLYRP